MPPIGGDSSQGSPPSHPRTQLVLEKAARRLANSPSPQGGAKSRQRKAIHLDPPQFKDAVIPSTRYRNDDLRTAHETWVPHTSGSAETAFVCGSSGVFAAVVGDPEWQRDQKFPLSTITEYKPLTPPHMIGKQLPHICTASQAPAERSVFRRPFCSWMAIRPEEGTE